MKHGRHKLNRLTYKFIVRSAVILTLSIVLVEIVVYFRGTQQIEELTIQRMTRAVERNATQIDNLLQKVNVDLETLTELPAIESFFLNTRYELFREAAVYRTRVTAFVNQLHQREEAYVWVKVCTLEAVPLIAVFKGKKQEPSGVEACQTNDTENVLGFITDDSNEEPVIIVQRKVSRGDAVLGLVEIQFSLSDILDNLAAERIFRTGHVSLFNRFGHVIRHGGAEPFDLKLSDFARSNLDNAELYHKGDLIRVFKSNLEQVPWTVVAHVVEAEMFSELNKTVTDTLLLIVLVLILEMLLVVYFVRTLITDRVSHLLDGTRTLMKGNYGNQLRVGSMDELGELTQSFNHMSHAIAGAIDKLKENQQSLTREIETRTLIQHKLQENESKLKSILDNTTSIISIKSFTGHYLLVNNAFLELYGLTETEVMGRTHFELFDSGLARSYENNERKVVEQAQPIQVEELAMTRKGLRYYISNKFPLYDNENQMYAVCSIATDITDRKKAEELKEMHFQQMKLADQVFRVAGEGIVITDSRHRIMDVNPAYETITGYSKDEILGSDEERLFGISLDDEAGHAGLWREIEVSGIWRGEIIGKHRDGTLLPLLLNVSSIRNEAGHPVKYIAVFSDISEQKSTENQLQRLAHYDNLTGLANRLLLEDRINHAIDRAKRDKNKLAVIFIDLDNFKYVNDTFGHKSGDRLLQTLAERLQKHVRQSDTVARLGGDEFIILVEGFRHESNLSGLCEKIREEVEVPVDLTSQQVFASCSIGVSVYPEDGSNFNDLFKKADTAMYAAKASGKNQYRFFSRDMHQTARERVETELLLRRHIDNDQLQIHIQPIVSARTHHAALGEVLVRMQRDDGSYVRPDFFIKIAEEVGLINKLGDQVFIKACAWLRDALVVNPNMRLSVNISPLQFMQRDIEEKIVDVVEQFNIPASALELEITEGVVISDLERAIGILDRLIERGFTVSLDDFGTGQSSLSYLRRLPVSKVKLDRSFIDEVPANVDDCEIVKAVVNMVLALERELVCEGIESLEQLHFLENLGCHYMQGYFFSKPLEPSALTRYLELHSVPSNS